MIPDQPYGSSQYWIDVTSLMSWRGSFTGIQRTQYALAQEFFNAGNGRFFYWDGAEGIQETSFPDISKQYFSGVEKSALSKFSKRVSQFIFRGLRSTHPSNLKTDQDLLVSTRHLRHPFGNGATIFLFGATWVQEHLLADLMCIREDFKIKVVLTVFDLIPVKFPHFFEEGVGEHFTQYFELAFKAADAFVVISENTKTDLEEFRIEKNYPSKPVLRLLLGDNVESSLPAKNSPFPELTSEFILAVGTFEIRKNYELLCSVWSDARMNNVPLPRLVIVGKKGWLADDALKAIHSDNWLKQRVLILHSADDGELNWLYQNCMFTVYPSWYEGWGLPIVESLAAGKLCIASETSSMPEAGGDLAIYANPHRAEQFLKLISFYYSHPDLLAEKNKSIAKGYVPRTWAQSFAHLISEISQLH